MWTRRIFGVLLAALVMVIDQATKTAAASFLRGVPDGIRVNGILNLVQVHNRGISFGMFNGVSTQPMQMIVMAALICVCLAVWLLRAGRSMTIVGIGFVVGGACGNIIDRISMGYVLDFLSFHIGSHAWPAFNAADSAICIGAAVLIVDSFLAERTSLPKQGAP